MGKAFEFMLEKVEEDRKAAGLLPVEEIRAKFSEDTSILALVNTARAALGAAVQVQVHPMFTPGVHS